MIEIARDVVDVWDSRLDISDEDVANLFDTLSRGEQARSKGFVDSRGYRQYVISRGRMRQVLGAPQRSYSPFRIEPTDNQFPLVATDMRVSFNGGQRPTDNILAELEPQFNPLMLDVSHDGQSMRQSNRSPSPRSYNPPAYVSQPPAYGAPLPGPFAPQQPSRSPVPQRQNNNPFMTKIT